MTQTKTLKPAITTSSVARLARNIASGYVAGGYSNSGDIPYVAQVSVKLAYAIVAEIEKHEPYRGVHS